MRRPGTFTSPRVRCTRECLNFVPMQHTSAVGYSGVSLGHCTAVKAEQVISAGGYLVMAVRGFDAYRSTACVHRGGPVLGPCDGLGGEPT